MFSIEYEACCACCSTKTSKRMEYSTFEHMNEDRMYLLQALEENKDIYFASLQTLANNKLLSCYYVSGTNVMIVDKNGEWFCNKHQTEEVA